jgi:hypothetical protein
VTEDLRLVGFHATTHTLPMHVRHILRLALVRPVAHLQAFLAGHRGRPFRGVLRLSPRTRLRHRGGPRLQGEVQVHDQDWGKIGWLKLRAGRIRLWQRWNIKAVQKNGNEKTTSKSGPHFLKRTNTKKLDRIYASNLCIRFSPDSLCSASSRCQFGVVLRCLQRIMNGWSHYFTHSSGPHFPEEEDGVFSVQHCLWHRYTGMSYVICRMSHCRIVA